MVAEGIALKRLSTLEPTQEAIETLTLWVLHHKDSAETICTAWMKAFTDGDEKLRLSLFYLANDVVQKAKKKQCEHVKTALFDKVAEAVKLVKNDVNLQSKVNRILKIWEERSVFTSKQIKELRNARRSSAPAPAESNSNVSVFSPAEDGGSNFQQDILDFDPSLLVTALERNVRAEQMIERARALLTSAHLDLRTKVKESLKDRETGKRVLKDVDETCARMSDFVEALEAAVQQHQRMLVTLDHGRAFFGQQLRDATVVEDAYRKFGLGIGNVKEQVDEMIRTGVFPAASPPRDAPSPGDNDDPFEEGVENAIKELKKPGARDLIESSDMDLDDEAGDIGAIQTSGSFMDNPEMVASLKRVRVDPRLARKTQPAVSTATAPAPVPIAIQMPSASDQSPAPVPIAVHVPSIATTASSTPSPIGTAAPPLNSPVMSWSPNVPPPNLVTSSGNAPPLPSVSSSTSSSAGSSYLPNGGVSSVATTVSSPPPAYVPNLRMPPPPFLPMPPGLPPPPMPPPMMMMSPPPTTRGGMGHPPPGFPSAVSPTSSYPPPPPANSHLRHPHPPGRAR